MNENQNSLPNNPLKFDASGLLDNSEGARLEHHFELDKLPLNLEGGEKPQEATSIKGFLGLIKTLSYIRVQGKAEADVILECVRCLRDFPYHLTFDLAEAYRIPLEVYKHRHIEPGAIDEESSLEVEDKHYINLTEAIRQQILVSLPITPVCGDNCPGYQDRLDEINRQSTLHEENETNEEDVAEPIDNRWSTLSKLAEKDIP